MFAETGCQPIWRREGGGLYYRATAERHNHSTPPSPDAVHHHQRCNDRDITVNRHRHHRAITTSFARKENPLVDKSVPSKFYSTCGAIIIGKEQHFDVKLSLDHLQTIYIFHLVPPIGVWNRIHSRLPPRAPSPSFPLRSMKKKMHLMNAPNEYYSHRQRIPHTA